MRTPSAANLFVTTALPTVSFYANTCGMTTTSPDAEMRVSALPVGTGMIPIVTGAASPRHRLRLGSGRQAFLGNA